MLKSSYFIVGGAGFVGSHFADRLLSDPSVERVTAYDNFSSGRHWHVAPHMDDPRFALIEADVHDLDLLTTSMEGHQVVIHLASNPDIAAAATDPAIDFRAGTVLTHNVIEAARVAGVDEILYASGSGVYGDVADLEAPEDHGPLIPVSTYAAAKLAGEAMLSSYCYMFGLTGRAFRFGNVVGPRQTHGVGFDFVRRLRAEPGHLQILGDGQQSKSYIHVQDVINAVLIASDRETSPYNVYNVATGDYITVTEIAGIAIDALGLDPAEVELQYTGGDRGWKGDVPVVRLNSDRIIALGWSCERSTGDALRASIDALIQADEAGQFDVS
ncbi:NAD-dependent epimerase/dehydratase family protein [soil metagenome]